MIPNGKEMQWHGHHLVFESEADPCRGCFFADKDECPDCDMGAWVEQKSYHCASIEIYHNNWHTGTPTEEGWYLLAYKHLDGYRYTTDYFVKGCWTFMPIRVFNDMVGWQKIEPFKEDST